MAITIECTLAQMQSVLTSLGVTSVNGDKIIYSVDTTDPLLVNQLMVLNAAVSDHLFTPRVANGNMATKATLLAAYPAAIEVRALG